MIGKNRDVALTLGSTAAGAEKRSLDRSEAAGSCHRSEPHGRHLAVSGTIV